MTTCSRAGGCAGGRYPFLTSKERDNETGLDYFLARYYSSVQGRFTSPDEFKGGPEELFGEVDPHDPLFYADTAEPQSLNKYHYALNNPLRYVDPDGHQTATADALKIGAVLTAIPTVPTKIVGGVIIGGVIGYTVYQNRAEIDSAFRNVKVESPMQADMADLRRLRQNSENNAPKEVVIDGSKHPESAANAADAQKAGKPSELTVDRPNASNRRKEALEGNKKVPGKDRDEYPPAVFKEGGRGAQVRPINPSDNRGAGASIGRQLKGVANGEKVNIVIKNWFPSVLP